VCGFADVIGVEGSGSLRTRRLAQFVGGDDEEGSKVVGRSGLG